ncbi:hypothetical protein [Tissierella simiarum]|nr:hypothetical protein [Tissierella simiarum]
MKKIGIFEAMILCRKYKKMNEAEKVKIQKERLHKIVSYAR